ncbi:MAG: hypothetical protein EB060_10935 [Proteobacteria bacterium]|nr:hypothetical protein [Pseudomonadota bacterium]
MQTFEEFFNEAEIDVEDGTIFPVKRIHDPSDPYAFLFEKKPDQLLVDGEPVKTDRRNENQKPPIRSCLTDDERKRFDDDMFVDKMTLPIMNMFDDNILNIQMIKEELLREHRGLSTIVMSRATLAACVDFGYYEAFGQKLADDMDSITKAAHIVNLVGKLLPVFGQIRRPPAAGFGAKSKFFENHKPVCEGHKFAFEPVIVSTAGDGPGDSGEIVCQGVIVSNKGVNFSPGDPRRVSLGRRIEFEESLCWILVMHVYSPPIRYDALGPYPTTKTKEGYKFIPTEGKNIFDGVFLWNEFMASHTDQLGCGVSRFGFTDTKQTGKDMMRRLFPWSVRYAADTLEWFRERGTLRQFLIETPMSTGRRASERDDNPSGMDVRRFLLAELLLVGTPLENMLKNELVTFDFDPPRVDGGGYLYDKLISFFRM